MRVGAGPLCARGAAWQVVDHPLRLEHQQHNACSMAPVHVRLCCILAGPTRLRLDTPVPCRPLSAAAAPDPTSGVGPHPAADLRQTLEELAAQLPPEDSLPPDARQARQLLASILSLKSVAPSRSVGWAVLDAALCG